MHKSAHHINPHFHRLGRCQHVSRLNRPMLGKRIRQGFGKFELLEVVAICDHLGLLSGSELKQEVSREALPVAFDLFVKPLGFHAIQRGQVHIDHHPQATNDLDTALDARH